MSNPLRNLNEEPFKSWIEELDDNEVINLIEAVSDNMKKRNDLLKLDLDNPNIQNIIQDIIEGIVSPKTESG